ncbi:hypothetical protein [Listeria monocytogenes]|uniref:Uncharacterized protein n=1 Tax=Listeria monocytogenes TaxID=1639 RepID=A0A6C8MZZ8_LISMN|nr:hypothetical protein [Listeria monocytogenes]KAA9534118.1 hypothetical protein DCK33_08235 [Listeria monocytogenes]KAA9541457.1 hypothetical protein DCK32_10230 [Listeria monocytogenes]
MNEYVKAIVEKRIMQLERENIIGHHQESNWYASLPETQELSALKHFLRTNDQDEEYVKLKLDTYEYFREMEKMKHLKDWRELLDEISDMIRVYGTATTHITSLYVSKEKLENIIKEVYSMSDGNSIIWE